MKITDIPRLVRSVVEVYGPLTDDTGGEQPYLATAPEVLAGMVRGVLEVHEHDLYRWDPQQAQAVAVDDVAAAEFAICQACGRIAREFFWCWTIRQLYIVLANATDTDGVVWQGWNDMAEAMNRARAAYPAPVASAVIRALNEPSFTTEYRTNLLDAVLTCTQAVPAQPVPADGGTR